MTTPRMVMILSENWTMTSGRDLGALVNWSRHAEDAGFDAVMISEHIVLGPDASANGVMGNPRDYALPGNQDPLTPWPNSVVLLSGIAAVTTRLRLVAGAILAPLRHPLLLARELGTLDLLSQGRLVVQPTVSWSRDEYAAMGVPFARRGRILDEQLQILDQLWRNSPDSYTGEFFAYQDIYLEPKAFRSNGPRMWFGGQHMHPTLLNRLIRYGNGFHPLGVPTTADIELLRTGMLEAGRSADELEFIGGTRANFPDNSTCADLGQAMSSIPEQMDQGYTTFCLKPSQFIDDAAQIPRFLTRVMRRAEAMSRSCSTMRRGIGSGSMLLG